MSLTYPRGDGPVLKNISLNFLPGEKIGIVGRTGAGKSSLIGALFRLVETTTGTPPHRGGIAIDGVDISQIGMHDLREKMAIIPQEPFLFRGTLRFNLDPVGRHQDADLWAALEAAELKRMVEALEGGLDAVVDDNGKNFSIGERQLLSLARAVLRRSKIIVMDEATANVDLRSDRMIQKAIHSQFEGATVFTIAHRLNTVVGDYDRILVLDQGQVMEFGEPWELLQLENGWFRGMVAGTGAENEAVLTKPSDSNINASHRPTGTTLLLCNNNIGDNGAQALGGALKINSTLNTLDLQTEKIWFKRLLTLTEAFKFDFTLTSIFLQNNRRKDTIDPALSALHTQLNPDQFEFVEQHDRRQCLYGTV
ncbi:Multidrug resistance-associated protein 4 [Podila epicladia]|nr:Multidrug resistance-associated protein 4 [Podila epicladia]